MKIQTLLKDVILAEFIEPPLVSPSGLIHLPETKRETITLVPVRVLEIGTKFRYKDDVKVGDIVYVPSHFGNALDRHNYKSARLFDGEDVAAIKVE